MVNNLNEWGVVSGRQILAIDVGFAASGLALFEVTKDDIILKAVECVREDEDKKKQHLYVAELDADRIARSTRRIIKFIQDHRVTKIVVELPAAGSKNGRASRCMGAATGMIVAIVEALGLVAEWYTPNEGKLAACGKINASKDEMMSAMQKRFPSLANITIKADKEHVADACACALVASNKNLVRMIRSGL
jgi:Holliday junction resolvasome RuvABC endonuclease subunit